jgi:hypothetical protein
MMLSKPVLSKAVVLHSKAAVQDNSECALALPRFAVPSCSCNSCHDCAVSLLPCENVLVTYLLGFSHARSLSAG